MEWVKTKNQKFPKEHQWGSLFYVMYLNDENTITNEIALFNGNDFMIYGTNYKILDMVAWIEVKVPSISFSDKELEELYGI